MPGRELLGRIVEEFGLDKAEAFKIYTAKDPAEFGEFLRAQVFEVSSDDDTEEEAPHAGNAAA